MKRMRNEYDFIADVSGSFSPVASAKATKALQFYEDTADYIGNLVGHDDEESIDWDMVRALCKVGKGYSHERYMSFVAKHFGTTKEEMKKEWRNINCR